MQKSTVVRCDPALSQEDEEDIRTKQQGRDHFCYTPGKAATQFIGFNVLTGSRNSFLKAILSSERRKSVLHDFALWMLFVEKP